MDLDLKAGEIVIDWEVPGGVETLRFALAARTGPGNGRMKAYFALGDCVDAPRPGKTFVSHRGYVSTAAPVLPEVTGEQIATQARFDEAIAQVHALAGRKRLEEAERQLQALVSSPDRNPGTTPRAAEAVCALALAHAFQEDGTVYAWLRDRGISLWYAWGSSASSGGEGASRAHEIHAAEERFAAIDRDRAHLFAQTNSAQKTAP